MTSQQSYDVFLSQELDLFLKSFERDHKFIKWINDMADVLKENKFAGDLIQKSKIPKNMWNVSK